MFLSCDVPGCYHGIIRVSRCRDTPDRHIAAPSFHARPSSEAKSRPDRTVSRGSVRPDDPLAPHYQTAECAWLSDQFAGFGSELVFYTHGTIAARPSPRRVREFPESSRRFELWTPAHVSRPSKAHRNEILCFFEFDLLERILGR